MSDHPSILVVDDQEFNRDLLQRRLEHKGYRVRTAEDGHQALAMISGDRFDLVLLDIMMPEMDGIEVLQQLRREHTPSQLPVIMVTARDQSDDVVQALSAGAGDYVSKPVDFAVLHARIRSQLALKRADDELLALNRGLERRVEERTAELVRSNQALRDSEQRYQTLYNETPAMFFTLDLDGRIQSVNRYGAGQLGYAAQELVGQAASLVCPEAEVEALQSRLAACRQQPEKVHQWEMHKLRKGGGLLRVRETVRAAKCPGGTTQLLVVCEDITGEYKLSEQISYKERHDELTGLMSRQEFERRLEQAVRMARENGPQSTLCYLDLDQFKVINDTCGHDAGDELLRRLADSMSRHVRREDALARLGGDEFGLLLENCSTRRSEQIANKLRKSVDEYQYNVGGRQFQVGVSIGLVQITKKCRGVSEVLSAADTACFAAKEDGRNRVHTYQGDNREMQLRYSEMQWVARIYEALAENLFHLHFQPIVPVDSGVREALHGEVLIRMRDADGSNIPPGVFLPAAERYFLSPKVDRWVVGHALAWLRQNPALLERLGHCSINLSGHSLAEEEFPAFLLERFSETGVPPGKICFEITETAAIDHIGAATRLITEMRALGCCFSLDDFGTGLSSFAYLKRLPVDYLKIDGQFVKGMAESAVDRAMVKSIHDVARVMGKRTIAEYVENDAILDALREVGVDYAQGYGIGRPAPLDEWAHFSPLERTERIAPNRDETSE